MKSLIEPLASLGSFKLSTFMASEASLIASSILKSKSKPTPFLASAVKHSFSDYDSEDSSESKVLELSF